MDLETRLRVVIPDDVDPEVTVEAAPVTLAQAQAHLRVDSSDDATLISGLILAATEYCETVQGRAYLTRTYEFTTPWTLGVDLPMPPFVEMTSVIARAEDGTETELAESDYIVDDDRTVARLSILSGQGDGEKLVITYTAGYGDAADVPAVIKQAILLLVGQWYEHREAAEGASEVKEVPFAVTHLLNLNRVNWN
jgi:uncharacterized phiE125 gp8 family phage protein